MKQSQQTNLFANNETRNLCSKSDSPPHGNRKTLEAIGVNDFTLTSEPIEAKNSTELLRKIQLLNLNNNKKKPTGASENEWNNCKSGKCTVISADSINCRETSKHLNVNPSSSNISAFSSHKKRSQPQWEPFKIANGKQIATNDSKFSKEHRKSRMIETKALEPNAKRCIRHNKDIENSINFGVHIDTRSRFSTPLEFGIGKKGQGLQQTTTSVQSVNRIAIPFTDQYQKPRLSRWASFNRHRGTCIRMSPSRKNISQNSSVLTLVATSGLPKRSSTACRPSSTAAGSLRIQPPNNLKENVQPSATKPQHKQQTLASPQSPPSPSHGRRVVAEAIFATEQSQLGKTQITESRSLRPAMHRTLREDKNYHLHRNTPNSDVGCNSEIYVEQSKTRFQESLAATKVVHPPDTSTKSTLGIAQKEKRESLATAPSITAQKKCNITISRERRGAERQVLPDLNFLTNLGQSMEVDSASKTRTGERIPQQVSGSMQSKLKFFSSLLPIGSRPAITHEKKPVPSIQRAPRALREVLEVSARGTTESRPAAPQGKRRKENVNRKIKSQTVHEASIAEGEKITAHSKQYEHCAPHRASSPGSLKPARRLRKTVAAIGQTLRRVSVPKASVSTISPHGNSTRTVNEIGPGPVIDISSTLGALDTLISNERSKNPPLREKNIQQPPNSLVAKNPSKYVLAVDWIPHISRRTPLQNALSTCVKPVESTRKTTPQSTGLDGFSKLVASEKESRFSKILTNTHRRMSPSNSSRIQRTSDEIVGYGAIAVTSPKSSLTRSREMLSQISSQPPTNTFSTLLNFKDQLSKQGEIPVENREMMEDNTLRQECGHSSDKESEREKTIEDPPLLKQKMSQTQQTASPFSIRTQQPNGSSISSSQSTAHNNDQPPCNTHRKFRRDGFILSRTAPIADHYIIQDPQLGEGSYGYVCKATKKSTDIQRAIKIIKKTRLRSVERFVSEIDIMKTLDHPNILRLYETFEDTENVYLILELCAGGELFDRVIAAGRFDETYAAGVMRQIFSALCYCHAQQVVHRDLKPENFLFLDTSSESPLKIIDIPISDFGLATRITPGTQLITRAGTPFYVAPEVLRGTYHRECDLWSAGVIMYVLLCGYPPFFGNTDAEVLRRVRSGRFEFPQKEWSGVSYRAKNFIRNLLCYKPENRLSADQALKNPWLRTNSGKEVICLRSPAVHTQLLKNFMAFKELSAFQKAVLTVVARNLKYHQISELKEIFTALDTDGDGVLTIKEINDGFASAGLTKYISVQELENLLSAIDSDGSGHIDYSEFLAAAIGQQHCKGEAFRDAFGVFDIDANGRISPHEIEEVLSGNLKDTVQRRQNLEEIREMVRQADQNGDGEIDFDEFCAMILPL